jgi:hypothetical protein
MLVYSIELLARMVEDEVRILILMPPIYVFA